MEVVEAVYREMKGIFWAEKGGDGQVPGFFENFNPVGVFYDLEGEIGGYG